MWAAALRLMKLLRGDVRHRRETLRLSLARQRPEVRDSWQLKLEPLGGRPGRAPGRRAETDRLFYVSSSPECRKVCLHSRIRYPCALIVPRERLISVRATFGVRESRAFLRSTFHRRDRRRVRRDPGLSLAHHSTLTGPAMHDRSMHQRGPLSSGKYDPRCVPVALVTRPALTITWLAMTSAARKLGQPCSLVSASNSSKVRLIGARNKGMPDAES